MATTHRARVIRAYALPVESFDTLKAHQRLLQRDADKAARETGAEPRTVTNSEALSHIVGLAAMLEVPARVANMSSEAFARALYFGDLKATKARAA